MTSNTVTVTCELVGMVAAVAPCLGDFYVLDAGDVEPHLMRDCSLYGWYTPWNSNIRAMLQERGEWHGWRPIITMDYARMREDSDEYGWDFQSLVWCVFIHELAHHPSSYRPIDVPDDVKLTPEQLGICREKFVRVNADRHYARPWGDHGPDFIRRALHLAERARRAGFEFPYTPFLCAGRNYGLSPALNYLDALGDEPSQLAGQTFAVIESIGPPRVFTELFAADVARWEFQNRD